MVSIVAAPVIKDHPESEIVQAVVRINGKEVRNPLSVKNFLYAFEIRLLGLIWIFSLFPPCFWVSLT